MHPPITDDLDLRGRGRLGTGQQPQPVKVFCPNCSAGGDFTEHVAGGVEAGKPLRPAGAVSPPPQGRRIGVEDTRPTQH